MSVINRFVSPVPVKFTTSTHNWLFKLSSDTKPRQAQYKLPGVTPLMLPIEYETQTPQTNAHTWVMANYNVQWEVVRQRQAVCWLRWTKSELATCCQIGEWFYVRATEKYKFTEKIFHTHASVRTSKFKKISNYNCHSYRIDILVINNGLWYWFMYVCNEIRMINVCVFSFLITHGLVLKMLNI